MASTSESQPSPSASQQSPSSTSSLHSDMISCILSASVNQEETVDDDVLGQEETKQVSRMKVIVVAILAAATMSVCFSIRRVLLERENRAARERYEASADFALENLRKSVEKRLIAVGSFSTTISANARSQGTEWPFFMMPDWNEQADIYKELVTSGSMGLVPFVTVEQRKAWETFSLESRQWIERGYEWEDYVATLCEDQPPNRLRRLLPRTLATNSSASTEIEYDRGYPTQIYTVDPNTSKPVPAIGSLFAPFYHFSPAIVRERHFFYNMDMLSDPNIGPLLQVLIESKQVVIGPVVVPNPVPNEFRTSFTFPFSLMYYPVFDDPYNQTVVAAVSLSFDWNSYLSDLLPPTVDDLVIVLDFGCNNSTYTFWTGGGQSIFLGPGDEHDTEYDDWVRAYTFSTVRVKSGAGLNVDYCPYTVRVYPAEDALTDSSKAGIPVTIFTVAVLAAFALTSLVFFMYDYFVERRHSVVLSTTRKLGQVVSSLFPSDIRERVVDENYPGDTYSTMSRSQRNINREPIAEYFPDVTVLFADLVGFTKYCSGREPNDAFILLESLFRGFDALAKRQGKNRLPSCLSHSTRYNYKQRFTRSRQSVRSSLVLY